MLEIRDLSVSFRGFEGKARVIENVSLEVRRGEKVALVGESGCGKSLTARVVFGLLEGGEVDIDGRVMLDETSLLPADQVVWSKIRGCRAAMIFQDPLAALNPVFTIADQMRAVTKNQPVGCIRDMLERVAIEDPDRVLAAYPFQLSGGMAQRVLIAMALINEPDLIVADEPATALDTRVQRQALDLLVESITANGSSLLLISHDLGLVRQYTDRMYVMYAGNIVESGSTDQVLGGARHPYTQAMLAAVPQLDGALPKGIEGHLPDYHQPPPGCRFQPRCPHAAQECHVPVPLRLVDSGHEARCVFVGSSDVRSQRFHE